MEKRGYGKITKRYIKDENKRSRHHWLLKAILNEQVLSLDLKRPGSVIVHISGEGCSRVWAWQQKKLSHLGVKIWFG